MKHSSTFLILLFIPIILLLTACQPQATPAEMNASDTPQPSPTTIRLPDTWTPAPAEPTLTPSPRPTRTSTPTDTATLPPQATRTATVPVMNFEGIALPEECLGLLLRDEADINFPSLQCSDFTYSPDQKYLSFQFGPQLCHRGYIVLRVADGSKVYRSKAGAGDKVEFLPNGKFLVSEGHCEGGSISLVDPESGQRTLLGDIGKISYNPDQTAFVVSAPSYDSFSNTVWGYNIAQDLYFLPPRDGETIDDHPIWSPDGRYVIYQRRSLDSTDPAGLTFEESRSLHRADSQTGELITLVSDPDFDYMLCESPDRDCDQWKSDWVLVRRFPFTPQVIPPGGNPFDNPAITCLLYGSGCAEQPRRFGLSVQSGELLPWVEIP